MRSILFALALLLIGGSAANAACNCPSTQTRCGSRPGSSSATGAEELAMRNKNGFYAALATRHNLQRYLDIMREIRHAISLGSFPDYLRTVRSTSEDAE